MPTNAAGLVYEHKSAPVADIHNPVRVFFTLTHIRFKATDDQSLAGRERKCRPKRTLLEHRNATITKLASCA